MNRTLLTGASGFIARGIAGALTATSSAELVLASRHPDRLLHADGVRRVAVPSFDGTHDWSEALRGVQVVVHAAARVHVLHDTAAEPLAAFRHANVQETANLAHQAAAAGVQRFVFLSSVGVFGSVQTAAFDEDTPPAPQTAYAQSKLEAEMALQQVGRSTGMDTVIVRPPLVYGADAPGNFSRLADLLKRRIPLPLGRVHNRRSWIGLDNLVDFIQLCMRHPAAANQIFVVCDGEDLSTPGFVRQMAHAMGTSAVLLPVPAPALRTLARLAGQQHVLQQLTGDLQIDDRKARNLLGWHAPLSVAAGMERAMCKYRACQTP